MKTQMKKILSFALAAALTASLSAPAFAQEERPFADVPAAHWALKAIRRASADGVMVGTGQTDPATGLPRFEPDADLTSAQFAVIVTGAFYQNIPEAAEGPWYAPFQRAMEDAGWDKNTGIQNWEAPMTRYQMAAVLYNIVVDKGLEAPAAASLAIADWDQVPEQYQAAVKSAYALELLSGVDDQGTFAGDQSLTRAQAAVVYGKLKDALTASGILMEEVLKQAEQDAKQNDVLTTVFTRYPGRLGTAYTIDQGGTPHGGMSSLYFVSLDGTKWNVGDLLPEGYLYGSFWSLNPTSVQFDETGERLSFVTRVQEQVADPDAAGGFRTGQDWGDTRIVVNVGTGEVESMEPVTPFDLTEWKVIGEPDNPLTPAPELRMTVKNDRQNGAGRPYILENGFPCSGMFLIADQEGITVAHPIALFSDADFLSSAYGKAVKALEGLSVPMDGDTAERREQVSWYMQVERNGQPVDGTFFAHYIDLDYKDLEQISAGQYTCMRFQFDQPLGLNDGDTLTIRLGPVQGE